MPARTGRDVGIDYYVAFSSWRLAVISEGVYARYLNGAMGDSGWTRGDRQFKVGTEQLAEPALDAMQALRERSDRWLAEWEPSFSAAGITRDVYRRGTGPAVVVVHEIPGITPKVAAFANDVVDAGFTVVMPSLSARRAKRCRRRTRAVDAAVCISREFTHWALRQTSPVIAYLRALARRSTPKSGGLASVRSACASAAGSRSG